MQLSPNFLAWASPSELGTSRSTAVAPCSTSLLAVARPRPEAPPVTTATRPCEEVQGELLLSKPPPPFQLPILEFCEEVGTVSDLNVLPLLRRRNLGGRGMSHPRNVFSVNPHIHMQLIVGCSPIEPNYHKTTPRLAEPFSLGTDLSSLVPARAVLACIKTNVRGTEQSSLPSRSELPQPSCRSLATRGRLLVPFTHALADWPMQSRLLGG